MTKQDYHKLKRYLKTLSRPQINELLLNLKLTNYEETLFIHWYNGDSVVKICMDFYISNRTYTDYIKNIFMKIYNYFKYKDILF